MKEYEFITEEDFKKAYPSNLMSLSDESKSLVENLNKLLNDKCQKGYTRVPSKEHTTEVFVCNMVGGKTQFDNHHAYVFLREIQPEKVECSHEWHIFAPIYAKTIEMLQAQHVAPIKVKLEAECPRCKCGEPLK